MQNPVRGFLHGTAALVSIAGLVALTIRSDGAGMTAAVVLYGVTLIAMYATSALYHSVPWQPAWKSRLQSLDHIFIYALVAATFTPLLIAVEETAWIVLGLIGIWTLVALGLGKEFVGRPKRRLLFRLQFVAVGVALAPLWATVVGIDPPAALMLVIGGGVYLFGALLLVNGIPRLAPRVFSHHEVWHVMVIIASVIHFLAVWRVAPA